VLDYVAKLAIGSALSIAHFCMTLVLLEYLGFSLFAKAFCMLTCPEGITNQGAGWKDYW